MFANNNVACVFIVFSKLGSQAAVGGLALGWPAFALVMAPKKVRRKEQPIEKPEGTTEAPEECILPDALVKHLKNICVCTVCGPGDRFSGRSHSSRSGHAWRALTPQERAEEIQWWNEIEEEGDAARLKILQLKRERARTGAQADATQHAQVPQKGWKYVLDFGKHSKTSLEKVWKVDRSYLSWCATEPKLLDVKIHLKRAMEEVGILATLVEEGKKQQVEKALKTVAKEETGEMEGKHHEIKKLHARRLEHAKAVLGSSDLPLPHAQSELSVVHMVEMNSERKNGPWD